MISLSTFIFRDFIRYILPTIIAACLFAPIFTDISDNVSIEYLIFGGAILGYIINSPIERLISLFYNNIPGIKKTLKEHEQRHTWMKDNWDYGQLFYSCLDDKERDFLYLSQSYAEFYKVISFYFMIYVIINIILLFKGIFLGYETLLKLPSMLLSIETNVIGNYKIMTILLIPFSFIICYFSFNDYLVEFENLLYPSGHYDEFSKKYHKEKGTIALSIWGRILNEKDRPAPNAEIGLSCNHFASLSVNTDADGYFQFKNKFADYKNIDCGLVVKFGERTKKVEFLLDEKEIPYLEFNV